ncbi:MAG: hypothetical protein KME15_13210 [Drouetiella hepatica Uher 2000/2452]|uniref:Uncharacterized protein n=1 Tax=Drouetiella hepatica Uher 2000/2452 TaxID=904376 RepID=A0A951QDY6_9CYAN|nr:hypothetical protein [Drouetiella hepatica Uher 2000/2452]
MKNQLISCLGAALMGLTVGTVPASAQAIQLGDGLQINLGRQGSELRPRVSSDGDRVNVEIYEQPNPETRVRISNEGLDVREVQPQSEQRIELSVPLDQN